MIWIICSIELYYHVNLHFSTFSYFFAFNFLHLPLWSFETSTEMTMYLFLFSTLLSSSGVFPGRMLIYEAGFYYTRWISFLPCKTYEMS